MRVKKNKEKKKAVTDDPVKNFEKWKKKYVEKKTRVKKEKKTTNKKRVYEIERENIQKLVKKYSEVSLTLVCLTSFHHFNVLTYVWVTCSIDV